MPETTEKAPQDMTRSELVSEVERLRQIAGEGGTGDSGEIVVRGAINMQGIPIVAYVWGDQMGLMTPDEALDFGLGVITAADASEFDAQAYEVLTTDEEEGGPGFSPFEAMQIIMAFRRARGHKEATHSSMHAGHFIDASATEEDDE